MESILNSCKTMLGIDSEVKVFDEELIIHINSVFSILHQLGVGTQEKSQFKIVDNTLTWSDFISGGESDVIEMVKTFMYLKLRLVFDPPSNSFAVTSFETQMKELEWRLCSEADPTKLIYGYDDGGGVTPSPSPSGGTDAVLKDDLTATIGAGGIQIGDKFIANTELEALWRALLDPVKVPVLSNPFVTITPSGGLLMESGSSKEVTLIVNFNRGAITPDYGTSGFRSGEPTSWAINDVTDLTSNHFTEIVNEGHREFTATVEYAEGEQPKNSKGEDYDSPLPAGSVTSPTISYEFVDALWSNQQDIAQVTKEVLVSKSAKQKTFDFPAQTRQHPEIFDVPKSWGNITIEGFNDLTQRFESIPSDFDRSDVLHQNGGGVDVEYNRYTDNRGVNAGPRRIRISWN